MVTRYRDVVAMGRQNVMNMYRFAFDKRSPNWGVRAGRERVIAKDGYLVRTLSVGSDDSVKLAIKSANMPFRSAGEPNCVFDNHIQDGLDIGRRAGNDAQNLTRCGLLLERFGDFPIALFEFVEQPDVFYGDDRL